MMMTMMMMMMTMMMMMINLPRDFDSALFSFSNSNIESDNFDIYWNCCLYSDFGDSNIVGRDDDGVRNVIDGNGDDCKGNGDDGGENGTMFSISLTICLVEIL